MRARPRFKQTETVEQRLSNEAVQLALQPPNKRRSEALSVTEGNLDRFLNEAEECIRQAEMAVNTLDKIAWIELAEDWVKLARVAKERDV